MGHLQLLQGENCKGLCDPEAPGSHGRAQIKGVTWCDWNWKTFSFPYMELGKSMSLEAVAFDEVQQCSFSG